MELKILTGFSVDFKIISNNRVYLDYKVFNTIVNEQKLWQNVAKLCIKMMQKYITKYLPLFFLSITSFYKQTYTKATCPISQNDFWFLSAPKCNGFFPGPRHTLPQSFMKIRAVCFSIILLTDQTNQRTNKQPEPAGGNQRTYTNCCLN